MILENITELYLPYPDKGDRLVRVYVPAHEDGETFPVVYMTDGQNVMDEKYATYGCWHTIKAIAQERELSGKAAIIVGIHSDITPLGRTNELTPKSIGKIFFPPNAPEELKEEISPEGEIFDSFVTDTVMPAIEARFPVIKGRQATAFCGSSSGGLQSYFTAISHPDLFCAAGVFSPAFLFYTPQDMQSWVLSMLKADMPYLYLYSGAGDALEKQICQCTEAVYDILVECYPPEKLNEIILPDQKHHESAWEPIFRDFLHTFLNRREEF